MTDNVTKKIVTRRKELGFTDKEVASQCGLSIHEYYDIELHSDEIFTVTSLRSVKKLCSILKFDFFELFEIPCAFCEENKAFAEEYRLPRNELIRKRRDWKGLSAEELGDRIGFHQAEIHKLETDPEHLESWPLSFILELASQLDAPIQVLLALRCKSCNWDQGS
jgi:transcriptional regulator with XRE-family HTH domain